jgi:hypothetical protein
MMDYFEVITDAAAGEVTVRPYTPEEIAAAQAAAHAAAVVSIREQRNAMLIASDWTQLPDAPVDAAAWADYRQALRDVTAQPGFPDAVIWPAAPA